MMMGSMGIAAETKKRDVDGRVPLEFYFRTANNLLAQAQKHREDGNLINYYFLLVRCVRMFTETITKHRNCSWYLSQLRDYARGLLDVIAELEKQNPEVAKPVDLHNKVCLNRIKTECSICTERLPRSSLMSTNGCAHEYCVDCCKQYAKMKLMNGFSEIKCPDQNCHHAYDIQQCSLLLSESNLDILNRRQMEAAIPSSLRVYCPYQDCSALMKKPESSSASARLWYVECFSCHRGFCLECQVPWHTSKTCAEYRADVMNAKLSGDEKLRNLAKLKKWQICKVCNRIIERKSGCNHMTCLCGYSFCYGCGGNVGRCKCR